MAVIKSGDSTDEWTIDPTSNAGRVTLYGADGTVMGHLDGLDNLVHQTVAAIQNVYISTKNSSTATIGASSYWEGDPESTLGVAGIQINTYVNKPHTVTVYQSTDGSSWDISDSWTEPASYGTARTVQATAAYYKIKVANNVASDATVVRIQTALCPIVEALPRALTSGGNLRVSVAADWQSSRRTVGLYAVSTFRTLGVAAGTQNIFSIENPSASTIALAVRSLNYASDSTADLATVAPQIKVSKPSSLPTGGTTLTAVKYQTAYAAATAVCRGGTASDGGGATAITATAGTTLWQQFMDRYLATGNGSTVFTHPYYSLIPDVGADLRQFILLPGESLLVQGVTSIAATTHMIVNCSWLEYQYL